MRLGPLLENTTMNRITMSRSMAAATALLCVALGLSSPAARGAGFSAAQLAEVQQRWSLAQQIVARLEPEAKQLGLGAGWRQATLTLLLSNNSARLSDVAKAGGYQAVIAAATARGGQRAAQKALGDDSADLVFTPFAPCRYIDTRNVGGKISGIRTYDLANNGGAYGGAVSCDPKTLAGVASEDLIGAYALSVTIVDTSTAGAPGFATMRPAGSTQTSALVNWTVSSAGFQLGNAAVVASDQTSGVAEIEIQTSGAVHAIVDLSGAFTPPQKTALDCVTVANPGGGTTTGDVPAGTSAIHSATCTTGYEITGGGCTYFTTTQQSPAATDNKVVLNRSNRTFDSVTQTWNNQWSCHWTNNDTVTWRVQTRAVCCRIPGR
jgi:hypothetical protein